MKYIKAFETKLITLVLSICILLSMALPVSAADNLSRGGLAVMVAESLELEILPLEGMFDDVPASAYGAQAIEAVCRAGFMNGRDGLFRPQDNADRITLASVGVAIFEKEIGKTQIPVFGAYYDDYVLLDKNMAYVLDVTAMMNIMEGISYTYFGCFEPADTEMADEMLLRVNDIIWRKRKLELKESIARASIEDTPLTRKISLVHQARQMERLTAGGIIEFDTKSLGFDFDDIADFFEIKADTILNIRGNAIAVRFDADSILASQITDVLVGDIPVDYVLLPGRILFSSDCFPVSGMYTVCIKSSDMPDICFEQMIHKEQVTLGAK